MLRWRKVLARVGAVAALVVVSIGGGYRASAQTAAVPSETCPYWIDSATGKRVATGPVGWNPGNLAGTIPPNPDANHVSFGSRNFVRLPEGTWIDAASGNPVATGPVGWNPGNLAGTIPPNPDENHVSFGGRNFVRIPCPPSQTAASTGLYIGGELVKNWGWVSSTERLAATDVQTTNSPTAPIPSAAVS